LIFKIAALGFDLLGAEFEVGKFFGLEGQPVGCGFFLGGELVEVVEDFAEFDVAVLEDEEGLQHGEHGKKSMRGAVRRRGFFWRIAEGGGVG
jgi:hypothetical protein